MLSSSKPFSARLPVGGCCKSLPRQGVPPSRYSSPTATPRLGPAAGRQPQRPSTAGGGVFQRGSPRGRPVASPRRRSGAAASRQPGTALPRHHAGRGTRNTHAGTERRAAAIRFCRVKAECVVRACESQLQVQCRVARHVVRGGRRDAGAVDGEGAAAVPVTWGGGDGAASQGPRQEGETLPRTTPSTGVRCAG